MVLCLMTGQNQGPTDFLKLAELSEQIMATTKRLEKMDLAGTYRIFVENISFESEGYTILGARAMEPATSCGS